MQGRYSYADWKLGGWTVAFANRQSLPQLGRRAARGGINWAFSAPRVVPGMHILQTCPRNVGVDLGGGQVAVAEQHLHHP